MMRYWCHKCGNATAFQYSAVMGPGLSGNCLNCGPIEHTQIGGVVYNPWDNLQDEVAGWADRNFGENPPYRLFLGVLEEVGEFFASMEHTPIKPLTPAQRRDQMLDALGDQGVYALNLCQEVGLLFSLDIAAIDENVPQYYSDRELLGVFALGARSILKHDQGIRGMTPAKRKEHLRVFVSMWYRWAQYMTQLYALPQILDIVMTTWAEVRKRDWKVNPTNAAEVAMEASK